MSAFVKGVRSDRMSLTQRELEAIRRQGRRSSLGPPSNSQRMPIEEDGVVIRAAGQWGVKRPMAVTTACRLAVMRLASGDPNAKTGTLRIVALAIPYGKLSGVARGVDEVYEPGCFRESLAADDLRVLFNFNLNFLLGRKAAGTALFYEDSEGLHFEAEPPDTSWGSDLIVSMDRGDIDQAGAMLIVQKSRLEDQGGRRVRVVEQAKLIMASVVSFAAADAPKAKVVSDQDRQLAAGAHYLSPYTKKGAQLQ